MWDVKSDLLNQNATSFKVEYAKRAWVRQVIQPLFQLLVYINNRGLIVWGYFITKYLNKLFIRNHTYYTSPASTYPLNFRFRNVSVSVRVTAFGSLCPVSSAFRMSLGRNSSRMNVREGKKSEKKEEPVRKAFVGVNGALSLTSLEGSSGTQFLFQPACQLARKFVSIMAGS